MFGSKPWIPTLLALTSVCPAQKITHRWSFNETGSAASGRTLADRIDAAPAVIRGNGASLDGAALTLPGTGNGNQTPQAISAYVDLPNGLLSSKTDTTIEIWATIVTHRDWQRLFDFGRVNTAGDGLGAAGEITGGGSSAPGGTQASDSFMLAVRRGGANNTQRLSGSLDGNEVTIDSSATLPAGTRHHFVARFRSGVGAFADSGGGTATWYLNGVQAASGDLPFPLSSLEDVNNWLGRSQWSNDGNSNINYDEFRIHDGALTAAQITASRDAGPDASIPATVQPFALTMNHGSKARLDVLATAAGEVIPSTLAIQQAPASGEAVVNPDGTILYTHTTGSPASDTFSYRVANSSGDFSTANVTLTFDSGLHIGNPHLNVPESPPVTGFGLENAFPGVSFDSPISLASPPGDSQRLFVCQKGGLLRLIPDVTSTSPAASTFLNLPALLTSRGESISTSSESGLLGLAFHPDYDTNRQFFIFYSATRSGQLYQRVSRFTTQAGNPSAADTSSELILIDQRDDEGNHNGGSIHFGPDGYLYISVGDEGAGNDTLRNSQTINKDLFAGILRIDVDKKPGNVAPTPHSAVPTDAGVARFSIPIDNPYVHTSLGGPWDGSYNGANVNQTTVRREFYATGLRNPWRMSFDPLTGELWVGDVGQGAWEEIDIIENGGNYGWVWREGNHPGFRTAEAPANFATLYATGPVHEYGRGSGYSVTGGIVYRGNRISSLYGKYVFGDYGSGNIWSLQRNGSDPATVERLTGEGGIVAFGTDPSNQDVLLADIDGGRLLRLVTTGSDAGFPATLSATGLFADLADLSPSPGLLPYSVNLPFWSDHALKQRWFVVPDGTSRFTWSEEGAWTLPSGTIWVKHFDLETERGNPATRKRIETRLLVKNDAGSYGVSYRWNDDGSEAFLVADAGEDFDLQIDVDGSPVTQTWQIPSRAECLVCHTPQAGHALSFNTRQLNLEGGILGFSGNQLATLTGNGFFTEAPPSPNLLARHLRPEETEFALEARVRSYIAVNCSYCHMEDGTAGATTWDGRPELTLDQTGLLLGEAIDNGGDPANKLVVPGDPAHSIVLSRVAETNGFTRMPPLASNQLDQDAIDLLTEWIGTTLPARQDYAAWRLEQFTSSTSPEGAEGEDPDLDGFTNRKEFLIGTSPLDPSSRPSMSIHGGGGVTLGFSLPENRSFRVMSSTDLFDWTPWDVPGNGGLPVPGGDFTLNAPLDGPHRFFQLDVTEN